MKIYFYQPDIRAYRVPLFQKIAGLEGVDCTVVFSDSTNEAQSLSKYKKIKAPSIKIRGFFWQFGLAKFLKYSDINVVPYDIHWVCPIFWALWYRKRSKLVFWGHGLGRSKMAARVKVWLANKAYAVVVYSFEGKRDLINAGICPEKIHVAVNTMFVSNSKNYSGFLKKYFVYVGRLQERKDLEFLINSYCFYKKFLMGSQKLVIVGDGESMRNHLEKKVFNLGLRDHVIFYDGTVDDSRLAELFSEASAYVSPGHVGLGVLHAFSYGIPVLTIGSRPHAPECEWIEDGVNGFLTEDKIEAYSETLKKMDDISTAKIMGHNAFLTYSKEAGPDQMLQGFKKVIYGK